MALVEYKNAARTATRRSNTSKLQAIFPQSPALPGHPGGSYNDASVEEKMATLTNGIQDKNPDIRVDLDYGGSPDLAAVEIGGGGLPGTAYTPAQGSPGAGSLNPSDIPEPEGDSPTSSGAGSTVSPSVTSEQLSNQVGGGINKNLSKGNSGVKI